MPEDVLSRPPPPPDRVRAYGPGPSQFVETYRASGPLRTCEVAAFHGGFWRERYSLRHLAHLCRAISADGFLVRNVEYRRLGEPGGGWPGTFSDVFAALLQLDEPALLVGHSAGGQLALRVVDQLVRYEVRPLAGVVALAPVSDLALASKLGLSDGAADELLRGISLEHVSPRHRLPIGVPIYVLHGDRDDVVPLEMSERFVEAAVRAGDDATLEIVPGADHYDLIDPESPHFARVLEAVRHLATP